MWSLHHHPQHQKSSYEQIRFVGFRITNSRAITLMQRTRRRETGTLAVHSTFICCCDATIVKLTKVMTMKKLLFAIAGAAVFALASASTPASAMPAQGTLANTISNVEQVQWGPPPHRHWRHHRCWNERVVRRDRWGRRIVTTRRVCR